MQLKKRIKWLDFIKGLCIFMVVFEHAINFLGVRIYNNNECELILRDFFNVIMMPCFFAMSGYLYTPINTIKKYLVLIYKKGISFGIPYIIFYIIFALIPFRGLNQFIISMNPINIILKPTGDLWFLWVLFMIFMIIGFMDLLHINKEFQFYLFVAITLIFLITKLHLIPSRIYQHACLQMANIIFFVLGEFIRHNINFVKKLNILTTILFCLSFFIMIFTSFYYDVQFISLNTIVPKTLGVIMMFGLASVMKENNIFFKYFTKYGRYTLVIYVGHFIPLLYTERCLRYIFYSNILQPLFTLIIVWFVSIFLCYLTSKIKLINFVFYPRKYMNKFLLNIK